jgi:molecular chaperone DnaK (HSP70)
MKTWETVRDNIKSFTEEEKREIERQADEEAKKDKAQRLFDHVQKFIKDQQISCAECVCQSDRVIENAYDFIEGCCDIVGYYEEEE